MSDKMMILPSSNSEEICLLRLPDDIEGHEAFRHAIGVIAALEEGGNKPSREEVIDALEDHGFEGVEFVLGPQLD